MASAACWAFEVEAHSQAKLVASAPAPAQDMLVAVA